MNEDDTFKRLIRGNYIDVLKSLYAVEHFIPYSSKRKQLHLLSVCSNFKNEIGNWKEICQGWTQEDFLKETLRQLQISQDLTQDEAIEECHKRLKIFYI